MRYEIIFAPQAEEDIMRLRAQERSKVMDAIEIHLRFEPEKVSRSRIKRLKGQDPKAWWEELLLRDPHFKERVEQARSDLRSRQGISIEQLRDKLDSVAQTTGNEE